MNGNDLNILSLNILILSIVKSAFQHGMPTNWQKAHMLKVDTRLDSYEKTSTERQFFGRFFGASGIPLVIFQDGSWVNMTLSCKQLYNELDSGCLILYAEI